jgi:hypothetical protein
MKVLRLSPEHLTSYRLWNSPALIASVNIDHSALPNRRNG